MEGLTVPKSRLTQRRLLPAVDASSYTGRDLGAGKEASGLLLVVVGPLVILQSPGRVSLPLAKSHLR